MTKNSQHQTDGDSSLALSDLVNTAQRTNLSAVNNAPVSMNAFSSFAAFEQAQRMAKLLSLSQLVP